MPFSSSGRSVRLLARQRVCTGIRGAGYAKGTAPAHHAPAEIENPSSSFALDNIRRRVPDPSESLKMLHQVILGLNPL